MFEVNTAKVSAEIPSPVEGKIVEILFQEGDTVAVGTVVAVVDMGGDDEVSESPAGTAESTKVAAADNVASDASAAARELPEAQAAKSEDERWYSPVVLQLAREARILQEELDKIPGTGYQGRLSKKDIKRYIIRKQNGGAGAETGIGGISRTRHIGIGSVSALVRDCNLFRRRYRGERDGSCPPDDCRPHGDVQTYFSARNHAGGSGYDETCEVA